MNISVSKRKMIGRRVIVAFLAFAMVFCYGSSFNWQPEASASVPKYAERRQMIREKASEITKTMMTPKDSEPTPAQLTKMQIMTKIYILIKVQPPTPKPILPTETYL